MIDGSDSPTMTELNVFLKEWGQKHFSKDVTLRTLELGAVSNALGVEGPLVITVDVEEPPAPLPEPRLCEWCQERKAQFITCNSGEYLCPDCWLKRQEKTA